MSYTSEAELCWRGILGEGKVRERERRQQRQHVPLCDGAGRRGYRSSARTSAERRDARLGALEAADGAATWRRGRARGDRDRGLGRRRRRLVRPARADPRTGAATSAGPRSARRAGGAGRMELGVRGLDKVELGARSGSAYVVVASTWRNVYVVLATPWRLARPGTWNVYIVMATTWRLARPRSVDIITATSWRLARGSRAAMVRRGG